MGEPWIDADLVLQLGGARLRVQLASAAPVVGLVGPSGGGKTSLIRTFAGVGRRGTGTLGVFGERWQGPGEFWEPWRRRVGWVPQDALLFPHLNVRDNLVYSGKSGAIEAIASMLGIEPLLARMPRNLSGGERQRVALGRALLSAPRLLLLDEPFAALDAASRVRLSRATAGLCRERGIRVVLVSHDERDLAAFDAELWQIDAGVVSRP